MGNIQGTSHFWNKPPSSDEDRSLIIGLPEKVHCCMNSRLAGSTAIDSNACWLFLPELSSHPAVGLPVTYDVANGQIYAMTSQEAGKLNIRDPNLEILGVTDHIKIRQYEPKPSLGDEESERERKTVLGLIIEEFEPIVKDFENDLIIRDSEGKAVNIATTELMFLILSDLQDARRRIKALEGGN